MSTDQSTTTKEALEPCPFCPHGVGFIRNESGRYNGVVWVECDWPSHAVRLTVGDDAAPPCGARTSEYQTEQEAITAWNSHVAPIAPVVDWPELDSDDDFALIADAINVARKVQEFIWGGCYPALRPYDAEGWRRLFQKRVDCIGEVDLTRHGGLAALRKRLLQQAALSIKALALVNRWAYNSQTAVAHTQDGADGLPLSAAAPASPAALRDEATPSLLPNAPDVDPNRKCWASTTSEICINPYGCDDRGCQRYADEDYRGKSNQPTSKDIRAELIAAHSAMPRRHCAVHNREEFKYELLEHELHAATTPPSTLARKAAEEIVSAFPEIKEHD